jgi:hypothetical protein
VGDFTSYYLVGAVRKDAPAGTTPTIVGAYKVEISVDTKGEVVINKVTEMNPNAVLAEIEKKRKK